MAKQANTRFRPWVVFLFHFLLFSYPLLSFLWRRSYPVFTIEVGFMFLVLTLLCGLLALVLNNVRLVITTVLSPLLVAIALMLQFNLLLVGATFCISISLFLAWRFGSKFQLYGSVFLVTLIMGAYFDSFEADGRLDSSATPAIINAELPPVIHILMDSFIGVDGLPPYPVSRQLKNQTNSFFQDYNFQVFPRAYSRYSSTGDSLYSAMNFTHDGLSQFSLEVLGRIQHVLQTNAEFNVMESLGYRLNVYQTGHMDFCQSNPDMLDRCWQYDHPNVASVSLASSWFQRVTMLTSVMLGQSVLLSDFMLSSGWLFDQGIAFYDPRVMTNLQEDLISGANGRLYFAHVLLPHGPFAFMNDCSINYDSPIWARYASLIGESVLSDDIYEIRVMKYFEQVDCALNSLRQIFEAMKKAGIYERSIIVIHGDHGSHIGKNTPWFSNIKVLKPDDYRAYFSTLFAVKIPGQTGQLDNRVLSLGALLEAFSHTVQAIVKEPQAPVVFTRSLPEDPKKVDPYVYLLGTYPQTRVDINIFED